MVADELTEAGPTGCFVIIGTSIVKRTRPIQPAYWGKHCSNKQTAELPASGVGTGLDLYGP